MKNYLFEGMDKFISKYREEDKSKKKLKESFDEEEFEVEDYLPNVKDIIKFFVAGTTREKIIGAKKVLNAMKEEIYDIGEPDEPGFYKDDQNIKEFIYDMQDNTGEFSYLLGEDEDLDEGYLKEETNMDKINKYLISIGESPITEAKEEKSINTLIEELIEAISPEDQRDSDILRDIITKSHNRINAKLTPEEKKIMDKYGLRRDNSGNIYVGDSIYRDSKLDKGFSRSELKKVNLADRARKALPRIEKNLYRDEEGKDISYAATERRRRDAEEEVMSSKVDRMKNALRDRNYHSKELSDVDKKYDKRIADLEKQIAKAEEDREWHRKYHADNQSNAQERIDKLLKKQAKPVTESVKKESRPMNLFESMNRGFEKLYGKIDDVELEDKYAPVRKALNESCKKEKKPLKEYKDMGQDLGEYQKWVDYDMKKDGKISHKTMSEIKKAGLSVVKDQYGQYEVIADKADTNLKK